MNDDEKKEFRKNHAALLSDEQIRAQARAAGTRYTDSGEVKSFDQAAADAEETRLFKSRNTARSKDAEIRQRAAERMIEEAQIAGPKGERARARLIKTAPADIAAELKDNTAEAIRARELADDKFNSDNQEWSERRHKALKEKAKRNKEADALTHLGRVNEEMGNRDAEHDKAAAARETDAAYKQSVARSKQVPIENAQRQIAQTVRQNGGNWTEAQTLDAARAAVAMNEQGVGAVQAMKLAIQAEIDKMRQLAQRYAGLQSEAMRLQMGPDHTGQFSSMSPWQPGGY